MAQKRQGLLPGESRRQSLVSVERLVRSAEEGHREGLTVIDHYIVITRRLDGGWTGTVKYQGEEWAIPGKVLDALRHHRESILAKDRSLRGKEQAAKRMAEGVVPFAPKSQAL